MVDSPSTASDDPQSDEPAGQRATQRIDKWLWAARFFKTRGLASKAIGKGQVSVNGQRVKPARTIGRGDIVTIVKETITFEVAVLGLNEQRRPAVEAQQLYSESDASRSAREAMQQRQRDERLVSQGLAGTGRPTKRQRRQIIRFQSEKPNGD